MYAKPRVGIPSFYRVQPTWMGTPHTQDKVLLPGGGHLDTQQFLNQVAESYLTVAAAGAAAGATTIPLTTALAPSVQSVTAIPAGTVLINQGTILYFGGSRFARLAAPGKLGDTTLTTDPLPTALVSGDRAPYSTSFSLFPAGNNFPNAVYSASPIVTSGILIGRTWAERDAGTGYGPAVVATDEEIGILAMDVNLEVGNECEIYMANAGNTVYENFLPNWATLPAADKAFIRSRYVAITGQP